MVQYTDSYSAPSSDVQNVFANKVDVLDKYVLCQTGQYEYTGLIYDRATKETTQYIFTRSGNNSYSYSWSVSESTVDEFDYTISNEFYCISNVGLGRALSLPATDLMTSYSVSIICCFCCLLTIFWTVFRRIFKR